MAKKFFLSVLCTTCFLSALFAQEEAIRGRVIDNDNTPISGVLIAMFDIDSVNMGFCITSSDGVFEMAYVKSPYILHFDHLSFNRKRVKYETANIADVTLDFNSEILDEITITAYRPVVSPEGGKLIYDFQQIAAGTSATNVYEAICKLPGVVNNNNGLQLAGIGAVSIIIDGKPTSMSAAQLESVLSTVPVDRVQSAEVMYSAPPQYNVRGAVINLVLGQGEENTYTGEVHGKYTYQNGSAGGTGANFIINKPKWSIDAIYNYNYDYEPNPIKLISQHTVGDTTTDIEQFQDMLSQGATHNIRTAFEYKPKENSSLSLVYNAEISPYVKSIAQSEGTFVNSLSSKNGDNALHNIAARYSSDIGLDAGVDYSYYNTTSEGALENIYSDGSASSFNINSSQNVMRLNAYADMSHSINNQWELNYGLKGIWAENNNYQYYTEIDGVIDVFDSQTQYIEWSAEAYVGASLALKKGSISASLTGEYYNLDNEGTFSIYPQFNFMWMFNEKHIIQINMSSDKTYPSYWLMQNSISYIDGYSEVHGNPLLKPMREYSAQSVYVYKQRYVFALFFSQTQDFFTQNAYQSPDNLSLIYKPINFEYMRQYGINAMIPFSIGNWLNSTATFVGLRTDQRCDDFYGLSFDRSKWVALVSLQNNFQISRKPDISFDLSATYQSPTIQGIYDIGNSWGVDAGLRLALLNKSLIITAKCNDIFESNMSLLTQTYAEQNLSMHMGYANRIFLLNASYRFGGYTKKEHKTVDKSRFGF